jgi:hypothetical protein
MAGAVLVAGLAVALVLTGVFDLLMNLRHRRDLMASVLVFEWSQEWPVVPLFIGILIGHLFWRNGP